MRFKKIEIALNILFWVFMIWLFVFGRNTLDILSVEIIDGEKHEVTIRNMDKLKVYFLAQLLLIIFFYIELYLIYQLKNPKAVARFVLNSILLIFGTILFYFILVKSILYPDNDSIRSINPIEPMIIFTIAVVICYGFTKKWMKHEKDQKQLELVKNQAELSLLRQQLQPHFLFNTLNNLMAMVSQKDNPKLAESIDKLSGMLRYVVYDTQQHSTVISAEINFISNFAALHLLRFEEDEIDFRMNVIGDFDQQPIESGILLCYVENAFKHGAQPEENGFIHVAVDFSKSDEIKFTVENSIPILFSSGENGGYGMKANQERLSLVYPDKHSITIEKSKTFKIQLLINTT